MAVMDVQFDMFALNPVSGLFEPIYLTNNAVHISDSGERDCSPGRIPVLVQTIGDTVIYDNRTSEGGSGNGFKVRKLYAVPVLRGTEEPPVITFKILDQDGVLIKTLEIVAALSERTYYQASADSRLVVNLDIAARVPCRATIEEL